MRTYSRAIKKSRTEQESRKKSSWRKIIRKRFLLCFVPRKERQMISETMASHFVIYPPSAYTPIKPQRFCLFSTKSEENWKLFFMMRRKLYEAKKSVHKVHRRLFTCPSYVIYFRAVLSLTFTEVIIFSFSTNYVNFLNLEWLAFNMESLRSSKQFYILRFFTTNHDLKSCTVDYFRSVLWNITLSPTLRQNWN